MERNTHGRTHCSPYRSHGSVLLRFGGGGTLQPAAMEGGGGHTAAPTAAMGGGGEQTAPTAAMQPLLRPWICSSGEGGGHTAAPTAAMDMFCWSGGGGGDTLQPLLQPWICSAGGGDTLQPLLQLWRRGGWPHCTPYCSHGGGGNRHTAAPTAAMDMFCWGGGDIFLTTRNTQTDRSHTTNFSEFFSVSKPL